MDDGGRRSGILTTVGAVDNLEKTKTYQMLVERLEKRQLIKVFGAGQMSFGMGVGGKKRYVKPEDFTGARSAAWAGREPGAGILAANPVVMGFGEVPTALESGVIDGLMTSIGGWLSVREQSPYYTTGGAGVFTGDYYMVSASRRWWDRLAQADPGSAEESRRGDHPAAEGTQLVRRQADLPEVRHRGPIQAGRVLDDAPGGVEADRRARRRPEPLDQEQDPPEAAKWVDDKEEGSSSRRRTRRARRGSRRSIALSTPPRS